MVVQNSWPVWIGIASIALSALLIIVVVYFIRKVSNHQLEQKSRALKIELFDRRILIYSALRALKNETAAMLALFKNAPIDKKLLGTCYSRIDGWKRDCGTEMASAKFLFDEDIAIGVRQIELLMLQLTSPVQAFPAINEDITIIKMEETIERIKDCVDEMVDVFRSSDMLNKMEPYLMVVDSTKEEY